MKTTKEFPATHSMSTEWFVADEEGNIALFSFDENGPVPVNIPEQSSSSIMTAEEDFGQKDENGIEYLELTDEQVEELMSDAVSPDKFDMEDPYGLFVQVEDENKKEFLEVFIDEIYYCLSHKQGIYYLESLYGYHKPEDYRKRARQTFLKTVKRAVYVYVNEYSDEEFSGADSKWPLPFYCYKQPYCTSMLAKRTNIPKFPFKEEQIIPEQRHKLIRVPFKFSEKNEFQIAKYTECHGYDDPEEWAKEKEEGK